MGCGDLDGCSVSLDIDLAGLHFLALFNLWHIHIEDAVVDAGSDVVELGVGWELKGASEGTVGPAGKQQNEI